MSTVREIDLALNALPENEFGEVMLTVLRRARELRRLPEPRRFSDEQIASWTAEDERGMEEFRAAR